MNWWIFFLAIAFWIEENNYFGWNMIPASQAELIADGIVILIVAIAMLHPQQP
jgi:hypothetical protein